MNIQIVGPGCSKCQATEKNITKACSELNITAEISHVYDIKEYVKLGVRMTPAVVVDGKNIISGKVPTVEELKKILSDLI